MIFIQDHIENKRILYRIASKTKGVYIESHRKQKDFIPNRIENKRNLYRIAFWRMEYRLIANLLITTFYWGAFWRMENHSQKRLGQLGFR